MEAYGGGDCLKPPLIRTGIDERIDNPVLTLPPRGRAHFPWFDVPSFASLRQFHACSAIVISTFAAVHLANHLAALAGIKAHIAFMDVSRSVYRLPAIEGVLLACVAFQIGSGLIFLARRWGKRRGLVAWLQAGAGAYLAFFLLVHVGAILYGRHALHLDTNFYFAAAGLHVPPFELFFAPYYFLAVVALFAHLACAFYWQANNSGKAAQRILFVTPILFGMAIGALIVLTMSGRFYPLDIPALYKASYTHASA